DFTAGIGKVEPGTRVVAEGPFGVFTEEVRRREKVLLVAGGIGITPVRALLQELAGDVVVLYRVFSEDEIVFSHVLPPLPGSRGRVRRGGARQRGGAPPAPPRARAGARPRRGGAGRLRLRAARHDERRPQEPPFCPRPQQAHPHRALRALTERRSTDAKIRS